MSSSYGYKDQVTHALTSIYSDVEEKPWRSIGIGATIDDLVDVDEPSEIACE